MTPTTSTTPLLYTTSEAAKMLSMSYNTVRHMMNTGRIMTVRPSKFPRIPYSELVRLSTPTTPIKS